MSNLFVDMQQRRLSRAAGSSASSAGVDRHTCTGNSDGGDGGSEANDADDLVANVLRLQLRKPKHWNWELSTSRSSAHIALPRILLYDDRGELLVDAHGPGEQIYKQPADPRSVGERRSARSGRRAATTNLAHSIRQALDREFNGLRIADDAATAAAPTARPLLTAVDFNSNELPDYHKAKSRSSSLKVRFKEELGPGGATNSTTSSSRTFDLPTPPSTSTTGSGTGTGTGTYTTTATSTATVTTPATSSSSGPREKRRYRRSHSSGGQPGSILERFSLNKGRFSSPEYVEEHQLHHGPRYFLRTSKAGTLVVQEESFSRCRRRRCRPRNSSSENLQNDSPSKCLSMCSLRATDAFGARSLGSHTKGQCASLQSVTELAERTRRKPQPVRRNRSDGHVLLLNNQSSTSDEEADNQPHHHYPQQKRRQRQISAEGRSSATNAAQCTRSTAQFLRHPDQVPICP